MAESGLRDSSLLSIIRGAGWHVIGMVTANVFGLLTNILLTRGLGASLYGFYSLGLTIVQLMSSISNLGADKAVLRFLSKDESNSNSQLGFAYIIVVLGGVLAGSALYLAAPYLSSYTFEDPLFVTSLRLFAIFVVLNPILKVTANSFRAINRPNYSSFISKVCNNGTKFIFALVAYLLSASILGFIIASLLALLVTTAIGIGIIYVKTSQRPELPAKDFEFGSYLNFSIPLAFKDAGSVLYTRVDILMLGALVASAPVGQYQVGILLSAVLALPLTAVNQIFPPVISNLYATGEKEEMAQVFKTVTRWTFTGTLPMAIGLIVYRYEILSIFGESFRAAAIVMAVLTAGQLTNSFVGPSGFFLMMTDHQYVVTTNQWVFGLLNVAGNYILIQWYGMLGAALATAATLILINLTRLVEAYYLEGTHPLTHKISKPIFAALVMLLIILGIQTYLDGLMSLFSSILIAPMVYFGILAAFGLEPEDIELIDEMR
jgi:O-antigen/teichoic acid export membrane protein